MTNEGECEQEYARSARDERTEATDGAVRVIRRAPTGTAKAMVDGCDLMICYRMLLTSRFLLPISSRQIEESISITDFLVDVSASTSVLVISPFAR